MLLWLLFKSLHLHAPTNLLNNQLRYQMKTTINAKRWLRRTGGMSQNSKPYCKHKFSCYYFDRSSATKLSRTFHWFSLERSEISALQFPATPPAQRATKTGAVAKNDPKTTDCAPLKSHDRRPRQKSSLVTVNKPRQRLHVITHQPSVRLSNMCSWRCAEANGCSWEPARRTRTVAAAQLASSFNLCCL